MTREPGLLGELGRDRSRFGSRWRLPAAWSGRGRGVTGLVLAAVAAVILAMAVNAWAGRGTPLGSFSSRLGLDDRAGHAVGAGPEVAPDGMAGRPAAGESAQRAAGSATGGAAGQAAPPSLALPGADKAAQAAVPVQGVPSVVDRMVVKSGSLTLEVSDLAGAMDRISEIVGSVPGAFVASSSTSYRAGQGVSAAPGTEALLTVPRPRPIPPPGQSATVTLKVPAADFTPVMTRLRALGTPVQEHLATQEVTEEYIDLEAQVRNLEALEQQYLRLMERAQRVEEIIPLQQRATEVRTQIDRLRGRMNLLQRQSDLATISVSLVLPGQYGAGGSVAEPRPVRTLRLALEQLGVVLLSLLDLAIYVGVYLLPALPIVAAIYWWRRNRAGGTSGATPGTPGTPGAAASPTAGA